MNRHVFNGGERIVLSMVMCSLACILLSLLLGALAVCYYLPEISGWMKGLGVSLVQLRPLHTTFASAWIFLGAVTVIYKFLFDTFGAPTAGDRLRFKIQMVCWGTAGLGLLVTLPFGITSGREYLGFHPSLSLLIAVGWICFSWTFFSRVRHGFWSRPVYIYMWSAGILYFLYSFAEGHAYLLPFVREHPVGDIAVQWKSCGSLVASFNQLVYGALIFLGERISGDKRIGQSRAAFALFGVGLLNSFTNYAHHTYHLPQSHLVKWIAFLVSMLEIFILVGVFREVARLMARGRRSVLDFSASVRFIELSKCWNLFLLPFALLISIPPLNTLIHGTHAVMAHAMGSEIAIDTYILFGVFAYLLADLYPKREVSERHINGSGIRRTIAWLNVSLVCLFSWLLLGGVATGVTRYLGLPRPAWIERFPYVLAVLGFSFAWFLLRLLLIWAPLFIRPERHKLWREAP